MDGAPLAEGEVGSMTDGTAFLGLFRYFQKYGPVYKLCFGPKSFIVVSDPTIIKYILKTNTLAYDKVRTGGQRSIPRSIHASDHQMARVRMYSYIPFYIPFFSTTPSVCVCRASWRRFWSPSWARASSPRTTRRGRSAAAPSSRPSTRSGSST